jgi:mRNA-degrading endonuclease toxin of MazEF toxin-antitoxin module
MSKDTCYVIPLTTSTKRHRLRIPIDKVAGKAASAIVSQMRLIDTKRLVNKIGYLDDTTFDAIRKAVRELF